MKWLRAKHSHFNTQLRPGWELIKAISITVLCSSPCNLGTCIPSSKDDIITNNIAEFRRHWQILNHCCWTPSRSVQSQNLGVNALELELCDACCHIYIIWPQQARFVLPNCREFSQYNFLCVPRQRIRVCPSAGRTKLEFCVYSYFPALSVVVLSAIQANTLRSLKITSWITW